MKKRSLFAAVAMLIVSAIVLTSATYAWFAASSAEPTVAAFKAGVENDDGSLLISAAGNFATNNTKKTSLAASDFQGLATGLKPVDYEFSAFATGQTTTTDGIQSPFASMSSTPIKVNYNGSTYSKGDAAVINSTSYTQGQDGYMDQLGDVLQYEFNLDYKTSDATAKQILMDLTTTNSSKNIERAAFTYIAVQASYTLGNTTTQKVWLFDGTTATPTAPATNDKYQAIHQFDTNAVVTEGNSDDSIIDMTEAGASTGGTVALATSSGNAQYTYAQPFSSAIPVFQGTLGDNTGATGSVTIHFVVTIWAEGQDANCTGKVSATDTSIGLTFKPQDVA